MKLPRLKKGLFGYTESSVRDYLERVDEEIKAKVGFLTDESTSLRQECADLQRALADVKEKNAALSEEKNRLDTEKEALEQRCKVLSVRLDTQERLASEMRSAKKDQEKEQGELADILIEAKKFADELKTQAQNDYNQKISENNERIHSELLRVDAYIADIDALCESLQKLNSSFQQDIREKSAGLHFLRNKLSDMSEENAESTPDTDNKEDAAE